MSESKKRGSDSKLISDLCAENKSCPLRHSRSFFSIQFLQFSHGQCVVERQWNQVNECPYPF